MMIGANALTQARRSALAAALGAARSRSRATTARAVLDAALEDYGRTRNARDHHRVERARFALGEAERELAQAAARSHRARRAYEGEALAAGVSPGALFDTRRRAPHAEKSPEPVRARAAASKRAPRKAHATGLVAIDAQGRERVLAPGERPRPGEKIMGTSAGGWIEGVGR